MKRKVSFKVGIDKRTKLIAFSQEPRPLPSTYDLFGVILLRRGEKRPKVMRIFHAYFVPRRPTPIRTQNHILSRFEEILLPKRHTAFAGS
jgi:hypothetical protein